MPPTASPSPLARALQLYDDQSLGVRAFVRVRHLLCPLAAIEREVPRNGAILDLGCGHGLFSALMAVASPGRSLVGVDPSEAKIRCAERLAARLPNVRFYRGTAEDVQESGFDAITILDVLYLLPREEKQKILNRCRELLKPGGRLILKTNDTHPAWKYRWAWFQEVVMTRVGLTMNHGSLHFLSCQENRGLLREAGFHNVRVVHMASRLPYPHTLLLGQR